MFALVVASLLSTGKISSASEGHVFYSEDFSNVKVGYLPQGWVGGEKLMVKSDRGRKFLVPFEDQDKHSVTIKDIKYPKNFEIRIIAYCPGGSVDYNFSSGSANFGNNDYYCWLNKTEIELKDNVKDKTFTLTFKKENQVLSVQVNGNEPVLVRDPQFKFSDTFTFSIKGGGMKPKMYEIKMIDLGH